MTVTTTDTATASLPAGHTLRVGVAQIGFELRSFLRRADQLVFTLLFPVVLYVILSLAFSGLTPIGEGMLPGGGIDYPTYYLPAMLASALVVSGIQSLATDIAAERWNGTLRRLAGLPMSRASYVIGKVGVAVLSALAQSALLLLVATLGFGVALPPLAAWATVAWVLVLGILACSALGIALSRLPRSAGSAVAVVIPVVLVLQFISGIYLPSVLLPTWLQQIAAAFPVTWMAHGMRYALLPAEAGVLEIGGGWQPWLVAVMLVAWAVIGTALAVWLFRWIDRRA